MAIDPVCGMDVDERQTSLRSNRGGKDICFCCPKCKFMFDEDPAKFLFDYS